MLELIFTLCAWLIQLIAIFGLPVLIIFVCRKTFSRKIYICTSIVVVFIFSVLLRTCLTAPKVFVPEEYQVYVDAEILQKIQQCNNGIYSKNIPVIPLYIKVIDADETTIRVRTFYYLFGTTEMVLGGTDAPSVIKNIGK